MDAKTMGNMLAYPLSSDGATHGSEPGLFKRELFAAMAMPVVVESYAAANGGIGADHLPKNCAIHACRIADALLAELAKEQP